MQAKYQQSIGVDEAGRGAWAGPVVAAACSILDRDRFSQVYALLCRDGLNDSKKMTVHKRDVVFEALQSAQRQGIIEYHIAFQSAKIIDKVGIKEANRRAMRKAIMFLSVPKKQIQIDGNDHYVFRGIPKENVQYIIKGDTKIVEIMMASVLAKVSRDRCMCRLAKRYPNYGFDLHKGYGTKLHQKQLQKQGPCFHHRYSYAPMREMLGV